MGWIIVWSFVLIAANGEPEYISHTFGGAGGLPYTTEEACEKMAVMAPLEPNLQVIEPRIVDAFGEDFTCTYVENYQP